MSEKNARIDKISVRSGRNEGAAGEYLRQPIVNKIVQKKDCTGNLMRSEVLVNSELVEKPAGNKTNTGAANCDDSKLVLAAQQGEGSAFSALVDKYYRKVYGLLYQMCGAIDAEDLTQEVFLRALTALRKFQFRGQASFRTWLYKIAMNTAINELRQRKRRRAWESYSLDKNIELADGSVERNVPDDADTPQDALERGEQQAVVWRILHALPARHRQVLVLIDIEGLEYQEVAQILGCPLGTLKSRVARARSAFAARYERFYKGGTLPR